MPLKQGYSAPDLGIEQLAQDADRRADQTTTVVRSNPHNYHGENVAADQAQAASGRMFRPGTAMPNLRAPFTVISMDGDNTGYPAEVHEIDINMYGDAYDSTTPMRVRTVAPAESHWDLDSDHDGHRN